MSKCIDCKHYKNCDIEDCAKVYADHGNCHHNNDLSTSEEYSDKPNDPNKCKFFTNSNSDS